MGLVEKEALLELQDTFTEGEIAPAGASAGSELRIYTPRRFFSWIDASAIQYSSPNQTIIAETFSLEASVEAAESSQMSSPQPWEASMAQQQASHPKPADSCCCLTVYDDIYELTPEQSLLFSEEGRKKLLALSASIRYIKQLQERAGGSIDGIDFPCVTKARRDKT
eukprot:764138-Hanusia_phi.AAC.9